MINLLTQLDNAGVTVVIYSPKWSSWEPAWKVCLSNSAESDGVELRIESVDKSSLEAAVESAYNKWLRATNKGIPILGLNQIEHMG